MIRSTHDESGKHRVTRDDYYRMADAGTLEADARVELLDGEIVEMSPIGPRHSWVVAELHSLFAQRIGDRALCFSQSPLAIDETTEPQPDVMLVKPRAGLSPEEHPKPADVILLIEVADTSLELDRGAKLRLYSAAGIREYWVIDLNRRVLIVHRQPRDAEYASVQQYDRDARVAPEAFTDVELAIGSLFGSKDR